MNIIKKHYCFFMASYTLEKKDSEERKKERRLLYEKDKQASDCKYARLTDIEHKTIYVFDGYQETTIKIEPKKPIDARISLVLSYLRSKAADEEDCYIKKGYDYAWIKLAIDKQPYISNSMERFLGYKELLNYSHKQFVSYIKGLGFTDICEHRNLQRYYNYAEGRYPKFTYKDCELDQGKADRRNRIITTFVDLMNDPEVKII